MLIKLIIFFFFILIIPSWFIYSKYISKISHKWIKSLFWLPAICLTCMMIYILSTYQPSPHSMGILSNFIIIFLCFTVPQILFSLIILLMKGLHLITHVNINGEIIGGAVAIFSLIYIIYGGTEGKRHFQIRETEIWFKNLPQQFDGYKIVQLSDIHSGSWTDKGKALS